MTTKPTKKTRNRPTKHASPKHPETPTRNTGRRYKTRQINIASRLNNVKQIPRPDPRLKPWPKNCVQIVAATPATVNVRGIREHITDQICHDCKTRLAVDSYSIRQALELPQRQGRPLRYICLNCFARYDRKTIDHLIYNRAPKTFCTKDDNDE